MKHTRRSLLVAGAALPGCLLPTESIESMSSRSGVVPWHLWGSSQVVSVGNAGSKLPFDASAQLAQVRYGRPENWQFLFKAQIQGGTTTAAASVAVNIDVTLGVGRSVVVIPAFCTMVFAVGFPNPAGPLKWTSEVTPPILDDSQPALLTPPCSAICAETVVVQARVTSLLNGANDFARVLVDCLLAPSTHVRPEWYKGRFPGGEENGT